MTGGRDLDGPGRGAEPQDGDPRPRVLLIGTSNAVMSDGYAQELAACAAFSSFEKRAIGLSSSALFTVLRPRIDFTHFDLCILDFCCNDAALTLSGYGREDVIRAQVEEAAAVISGAGCIPVLLIYPIAAGLPEGGAVRALYRSIADEHALPVLDGYDLLARATLGEMPVEGLFTDPMHLRPAVARAIGRQLVTGLATLWPPPKARTHERSVAGYAHRFVDAEAIAASTGACTVERRSRLTSTLCVELAEGVYTLAAVPGEQVVAVAADVGLSACSLEITGTSSGHLRLSTEHLRRDGSRFVLGVWPLSPPVEERESRFTLAIKPDAVAGTLAGYGPLVEAPFKACLAGLIVRKPAPLTIRSVLATAVDLAADLDPDVTVMLRAIRDTAPLSAIVQGLYRGILGRTADPAGLETYVGLLKGRALADAVADVSRDLLASDEYAARHRGADA